MVMRHWYTRFGIEPPFPWLPVGAAVLAGVLIVAAVGLTI